MDLAAIKAKELGGDQQTYYNNMVTQEKQRRAAQRLKCIRQKGHGGGLTKVSVKQQDNSILDYTNKEDITGLV